MDSITRHTLEKAGEHIDALDPAKTGAVHTITFTLDGALGGTRVTVETELTDDIVLHIR